MWGGPVGLPTMKAKTGDTIMIKQVAKKSLINLAKLIGFITVCVGVTGATFGVLYLLGVPQEWWLLIWFTLLAIGLSIALAYTDVKYEIGDK